MTRSARVRLTVWYDVISFRLQGLAVRVLLCRGLCFLRVSDGGLLSGLLLLGKGRQHPWTGGLVELAGREERGAVVLWTPSLGGSRGQRRGYQPVVLSVWMWMFEMCENKSGKKSVNALRITVELHFFFCVSWSSMRGRGVLTWWRVKRHSAVHLRSN